jgi:hypothetical protein
LLEGEIVGFHTILLPAVDGAETTLDVCEEGKTICYGAISKKSFCRPSNFLGFAQSETQNLISL